MSANRIRIRTSEEKQTQQNPSVPVTNIQQFMAHAPLPLLHKTMGFLEEKDFKNLTITARIIYGPVDLHQRNRYAKKTWEKSTFIGNHFWEVNRQNFLEVKDFAAQGILFDPCVAMCVPRLNLN